MNSLSIRAWIRWVRVLPLLAVWLAVGCGRPSMGEVSGVITYNGEPLPTGTNVVFMNHSVPSRYQVASTMISGDGHYYLPQVACGDVRITVSTPPNTKRQKSIEIPKHFADEEKSGLSYTVKPGAQTFDIKLSGPPAPPPATEKPPSPDEVRMKQKMERKKKKQQ